MVAMERLRPWKEALVVPATFVVLTILFCYPLGLTDEVWPGEDTPSQYLPYLYRAFRPMGPEVAGPWDPTHFTGLPESHCPIGRYYPFTQVLFRLAPPVRALGLTLILHHALAGCGAYLLARGSRLGVAAALLTGITFAFGGFLVFHRVHLAVHQAGTWLPWILWALDRYRKTGAWHWIASAATFFGLLQLGGYPPIVTLVGSACVIYLLYYTLVGPGAGQSRCRFVLGVLVACAIGCAAGLPQTLPLAEVSRWSTFRHFNIDFLKHGSLKPLYLIGLASPWLLSHWETGTQARGFFSLTEFGIFHGVFALAAAAAGLMFHFRGAACVADESAGAAGPSRREMGWWLTLGISNLCLMLGMYLNLHHITQFLPLYNLCHMAVRHVLIMGLALAWLAGLGLHVLQRPSLTLLRGLMLRRAALLLLGIVSTAVVASLFAEWPDRCPDLRYPPRWIAIGSACLALLVLVLLARLGPRYRWLALLVPLAAYGELWCHLHRVNLFPANPTALTDPQQFPEPIHWLQGRADGQLPRYLKQPNLPVAGLLGTSSNGCCWGLSSLNAYCNSMPDTLGRLLYLDMYGQPGFLHVLLEERGLSAVGGKYIVADGVGLLCLSLVRLGSNCVRLVRDPGSALPEAPTYPIVARFATSLVCLNPRARDLATLVSEVRPASTPQSAADAILGADRPVRELAYVVARDGHSADLALPGPHTFSPGTARLLSTTPDDVRVETTTAGEGFLVLAVTRCAGWSATVDGCSVPLHAVDGPLMGVRVPAGTHQVRLHFRPVLVWLGTVMAGLALAGAWLLALARLSLRAARAADNRSPEHVVEPHWRQAA